MKRKIDKFSLTDLEKQKMLKEIEAFYLDVREEKAGIIACQNTLDFFLEVLGEQIYNKALDDVFQWYKKMNENLEADFYSLYK